MAEADVPIRTFIAVELPADIREALARTQASLKRDLPMRSLRWVNPDSIHITLKFLGDVLPAQMPAITDALGRVVPPHAAFRLAVAGLGAFPNLSRPNVLWVGLEGQLTPLQRLRDDIESVISLLGFPTERRPFQPHLTLARIKDAPAADLKLIGDAVRRGEARRLGQIDVHEVALMRSDLRREGAVYRQLAAYPLQQG
ncbi:MAG: RNA 2',3'-cyclic phosphodiesterase [Anaerolineae bacterium]